MSTAAGEPAGSTPAVVAGVPADSEEAILERAGYKPELRRSLRFFSMFAIAFSIISITTASSSTTASACRTGARRRSGPGRSSGSAT
jgi:hypothetical protein